MREMFTTIAGALMSEPVALVSFIMAFFLVLLGGSALMFVVKGGTMDVLLAANAAAGPIERQPLSSELLRSVSRFQLPQQLRAAARVERARAAPIARPSLVPDGRQS